MKKPTLTFSLIILISILFAYVSTKPLAAATVVGLTANNEGQTISTDQSLANGTEPLTSATELSCADPIPTNAAICQKMEQEILDATVRFLMYTPLMHVDGTGYMIVNGDGHATIMNGRYLVTHNHFDEFFFSLLQQGNPDNLITIDIYNTNGELILQVPGQTLSVVVVEHETVVFDFGEKDGLGFFAAHGLPSAKFLAQSDMPLQPGMEVAQIDWDGVSSHVDWTTIEEITTVSETPIVKLSNCIKLGASGGGIFWQGHHIGNNWSRIATCSQKLEPGIVHNSSVALNSQLVTVP